jgi:uncharacterized protein (TIGR03083 family)
VTAHASPPTTIDAIVAHIAAAHQRLAAAIAPLTEAQLAAPALADGWSVKDVLAHLAFWDQRLLHAIAPAGGATESRLAPPVIADIPYDDQWLTTVNARIYALNRQRSLSEIQAELAETQARLLAAVGALTPHELFDPGGISAELGEPFAPMVLGAYEHYEEHAEDLEHQSDLPPNLSQPSQRALAGAGYWCLAQFTEVTAADLLKLHGLGPKTIRQLREVLATRGLTLKGEQK